MRTKNKKTQSTAMDYHANSMDIKVSNSYDKKQEFKIYPTAKKVILNKVQLYDNDLIDFKAILLKRKTTRSFSPKEIDANTLGQFLSLSFGIKSESENPFIVLMPVQGHDFLLKYM